MGTLILKGKLFEDKYGSHFYLFIYLLLVKDIGDKGNLLSSGSILICKAFLVVLSIWHADIVQ